MLYGRMTAIFLSLWKAGTMPESRIIDSLKLFSLKPSINFNWRLYPGYSSSLVIKQFNDQFFVYLRQTICHCLFKFSKLIFYIIGTMENKNNTLNNKDIFNPYIVNPNQENSSLKEITILDITVNVKIFCHLFWWQYQKKYSKNW